MFSVYFTMGSINSKISNSRDTVTNYFTKRKTPCGVKPAWAPAANSELQY